MSSEDALSDLGDFTSLSGLNNSGKSNVLKALNAFFTGKVEPFVGLNFDNDYYRYDKRSRNRSISVSVNFSLPSNFTFRQKLEEIERLLGRNFKITKRWYKNDSTPYYLLNDDPQTELSSERQKIDTFLSLINFRYIPNRVMPVDIIKSEHQALRDVLIRRLGNAGKESKKAFDIIQSTSKNLIENLSGRLKKTSQNIGNIRLATPKSWADLIFAFGYRLENDNVEVEDFAQGSGIQSLLMLETLYLIDKDYFQKFGWKQAAVWAIEEPESSLHYNMEAQVASFLSTISKDSNSRLQILATTHSDLVVQYSDKGFFVEQKDNKSSFIKLDKKSMLVKSSQSGVSRYVHPILFSPLDPIIFVEGKSDFYFIKNALRILNKNANYNNVTYLGEINSEKTGGDGDTLKYFKENKEVIKNRSQNAPVIMILDWDSKNKKSDYDTLAAKCDGRLKIFLWPENQANPKLGDSFKGIERFYPERLIELVMSICPNKIASKPDGTRTIQKTEYEGIKSALSKEIEKNKLTDADLTFAKTFLSEISSYIDGL